MQTASGGVGEVCIQKGIKAVYRGKRHESRRRRKEGKIMDRKYNVLTEETLRNIVVGSTFFGGGGGGSREEGNALVDIMSAETGGRIEIPLVDIQEMKTEDGEKEIVSTMVAALGSPTATKGKTFIDEAVNAVDGMIREAENCGKSLKYIYSGEQGGGNTMLPIFAAYRKQMELLDLDGNGRAVPAMDTGLQPIHDIPTSPVVLASETGDTIVGTTEDPLDCKACEQIARYMCQAYNQGIGFAAWLMNKAQHEASSALGQISETAEVGRLFKTVDSNGILKELKDFFAKEGKKFCVLCGAGKIKKIEMDAAGGFDRGFTTIESEDDAEYKVLFQNENLVAYKNGKGVATVPGIIAVIDLDHEGSGFAMPVSNTETFEGQKVALVYVEPPRGWKDSERGYGCWDEILISAGYCTVGPEIEPEA